VKISEIKKELGMEYKDIYDMCEKLDITLNKRHHASTISDEEYELLKKNASAETYKKNLPKKPLTKAKAAAKTAKKKVPKLITEGEIVINADIKPGEIDEDETIIDQDIIDELEIIEMETGKKFSKEERHKRQAMKSKKEEYDAKEIVNDKKKPEQQEDIHKIEEVKEKILIPELIGLKEFSEMIKLPQNEIIKKLMLLGVTNVAQPLDYDLASLIAEDFGFDTELKIDEKSANKNISNELRARPPVVTIMGHVDHGKTTLLDNIRHTNVAGREAGGITQHIGAYQITWNKNLITFIDTPGHEAFTEMRAQGATATDIAIIVIAADDGLKPQTLEAIDHARAAKVPIIIAINKIDRPGANPDKVRQELSNIGLVAENWGGTTIMVELSAKNGINIEELLEMIILVSEMEDLKADYDVPSQGIVVESYKHKGKGPLATIIVQKGVLHKGDIVVSGMTYGKIKAMFDEHGKLVERAEPSKAVEIMGLNDVPRSGDKFKVVHNEKIAREIVQKAIIKYKALSGGNKGKTLEELLSMNVGAEKKKLSIILKSDVGGTGTALKDSLEKLSDEEVDVNVIHLGVGIISETDVNLAVASNAIIIGFNIRESSNATKLAEKEGVEIRTYKIIYEVIDDIRAILKGMYAAIYKDVVIGQAVVLQTFKVPKHGTIAGCKVDNGVVKRKSKVKLIRDGTEIYQSKLSSLKRFKDDVSEVATGFECGIGIENFNDLKEGDIIEIIEEREEER